MSGRVQVTFDRVGLNRLKQATNQAAHAGRESFTHDGNEYLVAYAHYLIQYLEGALLVRKTATPPKGSM